MKTGMKKISLLFFLALALWGAGFIGYTLSSQRYKKILASIKSVRESNSGYSFISPLLFQKLPLELSSEKFAPLVKKIGMIAQSYPKESLKRYAVYLKDLNSGYWTGINHNDQYDPASLLKVIVGIAAYRQEEDHPGFINTYPVYTKEIAQINKQFAFAPATALSVGEAYSLPDLLHKMLTDSDNGAKDLLLSSLSDEEVEKVYSELSVKQPDENDSSTYTISALDYSRFFRILYNSTYLSRKNSNALLEMLVQAKYPHGIAEPIPSTVPISHKFGEHVIGANKIAQGVELHDCGIIYQEKNPYFLCVMTEGEKVETLQKFISEVSKTTYQEMADSL
jgi:beta-lactamase class A